MRKLAINDRKRYEELLYDVISFLRTRNVKIRAILASIVGEIFSKSNPLRSFEKK